MPGRGQPWDEDGPLASERPWADPLPAPRKEPAPDRHRSRWHWLLAVAVVVPLLTPLYNRVQPQLLGLPFFYWIQFAFIALGSAVIAVVNVAARGRRP